ncbi:site-specific integrase [Butyrivibrio sp. INlla16]|uniref:tyrosine-type recombinase/integrase n=1 Tax=Butyrivibrio sp. INlla16 TaxID=1520807 RepID=UPI000889A811|nr:site-specific integrase [Butyrivibrio sp. INlla16]SDB67788.1 Site-specific recombinase XerD [Butyrivibrio sp. INlla16]
MARPKKDGKRAPGIQGKRGYLYIVVSQNIIKDGKKKSEKKWIATKLADTPENVKKASEARERLISRKTTAPVDRNITISDYTDHFLSKKKREVADTTYESYVHRGNRIKSFFGDTKVKDVNEIMVENFLDNMFIAYDVQPRTVKDTKVFLGGVMDQAFKDGIIAYNPVKGVVINKKLASEHIKDKTEDDEFFSYEEAQLFLSGIKEHELYELFYVTLFFGLRREEVLGLRWQAIDFKNKLMKINHTVTKGTTVTRANTTKTESSAREYPLTDEQIDMFLKLKEKENNNRKLCGNSYIESDYIFKHVDGSLFYPDHPTKTFRKLIKKMPELPQNITFHGLRSSCVSILVHQNMDVKSIQKWVGHADYATTLKIYAKVKEKEAKKAISHAMNGLIPLKEYKE